MKIRKEVSPDWGFAATGRALISTLSQMSNHWRILNLPFSRGSLDSVKRVDLKITAVIQMRKDGSWNQVVAVEEWEAVRFRHGLKVQCQDFLTTWDAVREWEKRSQRQLQDFWPEQLEGWSCHYLRWGTLKACKYAGRRGKRKGILAAKFWTLNLRCLLNIQTKMLSRQLMSGERLGCNNIHL